MIPLSRLLHRPDFRAHPLEAIRRRLWWRVRWRLNSAPWLLPLSTGLKIRTPRTGVGALIYYQGLSEPETAKLILACLQPGMTLLDLGSHLGEYALLAARAVGPTGQVHAFEPDHRMYSVLVSNVLLNGFENVNTHEVAICEATGSRQFVMRQEPALSSLSPSRDTTVDPRDAWPPIAHVATTTLDAFCGHRNLRVDLIKMDVEGAELQVLTGAASLLALPARESPTWVFECASETLSRFGRTPSDLIECFARHGYTVLRPGSDGDLSAVDPHKPPPGSLNLVACKEPNSVASKVKAFSQLHLG